jgi:hypothetical protein
MDSIRVLLPIKALQLPKMGKYRVARFGDSGDIHFQACTTKELNCSESRDISTNLTMVILASL